MRSEKLSLNEPACSFLAWNPTERQCKQATASSQFSSALTNTATEQGTPQKLQMPTAHCCSALEGQEWEMPTSAQSISRNAVMFRALSTDPHSHGINSRCAAGWFLCMWSNDSCSAGSEGTKIILKKKNQIYFLQWKLKGKKNIVLLSPLLPNLGRKERYTFSRILTVPTKSESAATNLSSTQSVGGIILSLYVCWGQAPHSLF